MKIEVSNHEFLEALVEIKKVAEPFVSGEQCELTFEKESGLLHILIGGAGRSIQATGSWPDTVLVDRYKIERLGEVLPKESPLELKITGQNSMLVGKTLVIKCRTHPPHDPRDLVDEARIFSELSLEEIRNSGTYLKQLLGLVEDIDFAITRLEKYGVCEERLFEAIGRALGDEDEEKCKKKTKEIRRVYYLYKKDESRA
ncbi:MAG: hypothetical protein EBR01_13890 [Proteobacteria bacterium]|nr:hypothetical protein [Pseudomonadota bacterium]